MAAAAKLGSSCTGHGTFPPRATPQGELRFLIFGVPIHTTGHAWSTHTNSAGVTHGGAGVGTSKFVVFGKAACKVGDPVSCGSAIATGEGRFQIE